MTTNKKLYLYKILTSVIGCIFVMYSANAASVSARGAQRATQTAARANTPKTTTKTTTVKTAATVKESETKSEEEIKIENKSSQFDDILSEINEIEDISVDQDLAAKIKQQRDAFKAQAAKETVATQTKAALTTGKNDCDQKLRACMKSKCGDDFAKCAGDTDTIWGDKLDLCRQNITCTGTEYNLFTREIKADRDLNKKLAGYKSVIDCGNRYNDCIITQCGTTFTNCLGKSAGDAAIKKCEKIANECKQQDSGMSARAMEAIGNLRTNAEELVARDEQRLYDLRDKMRETCGRLGAWFDDRTLDCIYSINFYGGESGDLMASKKAYAGTSFNCDADWFGIDVTTFMENAARLTKSTKSATSAALGAGVGIGVGAVTSGAIGRAIDTAKAEKELAQAQAGVPTDEEKKQQKQAQKEADKAQKQEERAKKKEVKDAQKQQKKSAKANQQGGVNNPTENNRLANTTSTNTQTQPKTNLLSDKNAWEQQQLKTSQQMSQVMGCKLGETYDAKENRCKKITFPSKLNASATTNATTSGFGTGLGINNAINTTK